MFFNKKKSSADKAFEVSCDIFAKSGKILNAVEALTAKVSAIEGKLTGMEEFITEFEATHGRALRDIDSSLNEVKSSVKALREGIIAFEQNKEDAVTAAQILDEYLNGDENASQ